MKKLLCLVLVFSLASTSNAAVFISGPSCIAIGDPTTYTVDIDESIITFDWVFGLKNGDGVIISNYMITAGNRNTDLDYIGGNEISATQDAGTNPLIGPMLTFDLTVVVPQSYIFTITIEDYYTADTNWAQIKPEMHSFDVIIPEPMTMSLLALGGLGLIRRRRV